MKDGSEAFGKFGIGQPVRRTEDPVLLRGDGRYSDDVSLPGQAHAVMVRSPVAHGWLRHIDTDEARGMPGVLAIYTGADLDRAGFGVIAAGPSIDNRDATPLRRAPRKPLMSDKVRFAGDPVAIVIAETHWQAVDAAEAVELDIEPLPAVTEAEAAISPDAPQLWDEVPGNVVLDFLHGDPDQVAEAFARAAHVERLSAPSQRVVVNAMEPRAAVAAFEADDGRYVLHLGTQGAFGMRNQLAATLNVEPAKVRILTGHVGGSFGMKAGNFAEYASLLFAARELGRPVKWTATRSESFLADTHGRDHDMTAELALDADGRFLASRVTGQANMGAYLGAVSMIPASLNVAKNTPSMYRLPLLEVSTRCVLTNTPPTGPYRGAGRPEANYYMERLIDLAARHMGIDRIELRRRNLVTPDELPYEAASGLTYDSGDFPGLFDKALTAADVAGFADRRAAAHARGRLRGLGIGNYLEVTAPPGPEMGGVRFEADGTVTMITGTLDYGQGHATSFAQVISGKLGIPFDRIRLVQGDSDELIAGGGTGGSRSMYASGQALTEAADIVIERGREIAGELLEAAAADIEFSAGRFRIAGTDRSIDVLDLAEALRSGKLPGHLPDSLDVSHATEAIPSAFPNGCHIAEVEIDPELGTVEVVSYVMVNDFGTLVNPLLVEGQCQGGVLQGIGQALMEETVFDETGQLLNGTFVDYTMPRAGDAPSDFRFLSHPVPARSNLLGVKGCGEAGCAGALTSVMNAVVDALSDYGIDHVDMPVTPNRIWEAIRRTRPAA